MPNHEGLLELLMCQVGAGYISDLRKEVFHRTMVQHIREIHSEEYSVGEWQDVINYLTGKKKEIRTSEEGKDVLLESLGDA